MLESPGLLMDGVAEAFELTLTVDAEAALFVLLETALMWRKSMTKK